MTQAPHTQVALLYPALLSLPLAIRLRGHTKVVISSISLFRVYQSNYKHAHMKRAQLAASDQSGIKDIIPTESDI